MTMSEAIELVREFELSAQAYMDSVTGSRYDNDELYDRYHKNTERLLKALTGQAPSDGDIEQVTAK